eukprot:1934568-Pyramimonas_sp.AAC.2
MQWKCGEGGRRKEKRPTLVGRAPRELQESSKRGPGRRGLRGIRGGPNRVGTQSGALGAVWGVARARLGALGPPLGLWGPAPGVI